MGAVIGAVAWGLGALAANYLVSSLFSKSQHFTNEGAKLDDLNIIGSSYGTGIPLAYGRNRLGLNVAWSRPLREVRHEETQKVKTGKGKSSTVTNIWYEYFGTFGGVLCAGPQSHPERIWFDKNLVWKSDGAKVLSGSLYKGGTFEFLPGGNHHTRPSIVEGFNGTNDTPGYRNSCCIFFKDVPVADYSNRIPNVEVEISQHAPDFQEVAGSGASLAEVIKDVCLRAGLSADFVDVAEVGRDVTGLTIAPGTAGDSLETLLSTYCLQAVYSEGLLKFRPVEQPVAAEIPESDLIYKYGALFPWQRLREDDLPRSIIIKYLDVDRDYQICSQTVTRETVSSVQQITITANVVMSAQEAADAADILMYRSWASRERFGPFYLPRQYLFLEPGDVVAVTVGERRKEVRITSLSVGADGDLEVAGESYDPTVLTGAGTGDSGQGFPGQGLPVFGDTVYQMMDLPALTANETDQTGFYFAATGTGAAWKGCVLQVSLDGGLNYVNLASLPVYSVMGTCETVLPPPPAGVGQYRWDRESYVDVDLIKGELSSTTESMIWAGDNTFIIGDEIIQALTVEHLGWTSYRLSNLLRGRRGTELEMDRHQLAERCVFTGGVIFVPLGKNNQGATLQYRVVPFNQDEYIETDFTAFGYSAYPFRPVQVKGRRNSGGDLEISWLGTSRMHTELPNVGFQRPEYDPLRFRVQIWSADWGTVIRTFETVTETKIAYTAAQQISDFGSVQWAAANVTVQQYSHYIGWGFEASLTV